MGRPKVFVDDKLRIQTLRHRGERYTLRRTGNLCESWGREHFEHVFK